MTNNKRFAVMGIGLLDGGGRMSKRVAAGKKDGGAADSPGPPNTGAESTMGDQTIWVRVARRHVPLLVKACDETGLSRPDIFARLLRFFLDHEEWWALMLGQGNPRTRRVETMMLLQKLRKDAERELEAAAAIIRNGEEDLPGEETDNAVTQKVRPSVPPRQSK